MACYLVKEKTGLPVVGFAHIYKNGGMSIRHELERICKARNYAMINTPTTGHSLAINKTAFDMWGDQWANTFKFAVCRLPYTRLVSLYHFILQRKQEPLYGLIKDKTFEQFVQMTFEGKTGAEFLQKSYIHVAGENRIDHICHLETLQTDLDIVNKMTGLDFKVVHKNKSSHKHWKMLFSNDLQNKVYEAFKEDFEFFGYSFDGDLI